MPATDSSTVAGNSAKNSPSTGSRVTIDVPRSPCSQLAQEARVLRQQRPVEAELGHQLGVALVAHAALADHHQDRVAGHQPDQDESDEGHAEEGRDQHRQAALPRKRSISALPPGSAAPAPLGRRLFPPMTLHAVPLRPARAGTARES